MKKGKTRKSFEKQLKDILSSSKPITLSLNLGSYGVEQSKTPKEEQCQCDCCTKGCSLSESQPNVEPKTEEQDLVSGHCPYYPCNPKSLSQSLAHPINTIEHPKTEDTGECDHLCGRTCHGVGKDHYDTCNKCDAKVGLNASLPTVPLNKDWSYRFVKLIEPSAFARPEVQRLMKFISQEIESLKHDHEILVNTTIETKNKEIESARASGAREAYAMFLKLIKEAKNKFPDRKEFEIVVDIRDIEEQLSKLDKEDS